MSVDIEGLKEIKDAELVLSEGGQIVGINNDAGYKAAGAYLKKAKTARKMLDDKRKEATRPLDDAKAQIKAEFDKPIDKIKDIASKVSALMVSYQKEQEAIRQEAERKRREAEAEAERLRLVEERKRLAEQERIRREAQSEEQAEHEIKALNKIVAMGKPKKAPAVPTVPDKPKAYGTSMRTYYSVEVYDFDALVQAVADGKTSKGFLQPNYKALDAAARTMKDVFSCPGVKLIKKESIAG